MQLVSGSALDDVWPTLGPAQKRKVCHELELIFKSLHSLEQNSSDQFVGKVTEYEPPLAVEWASLTRLCRFHCQRLGDRLHCCIRFAGG